MKLIYKEVSSSVTLAHRRTQQIYDTITDESEKLIKYENAPDDVLAVRSIPE